MSTLVVLGFKHEEDAQKVLDECHLLQEEYVLDLADAVVVVRDPKGKVHLHQSVHLTEAGASWGLLSGGFWGVIVGLLCLCPLAGFVVGSVVGAGAGALAGSMTDYGIDDGFVKKLSSAIPPDSSALFILVRKAQPQKVIDGIKSIKLPMHVLQTSLSPDQEKKLRAALGKASTS